MLFLSAIVLFWCMLLTFPSPGQNLIFVPVIYSFILGLKPSYIDKMESVRGIHSANIIWGTGLRAMLPCVDMISNKEIRQVSLTLLGAWSRSKLVCFFTSPWDWAVEYGGFHFVPYSVSLYFHLNSHNKDNMWFLFYLSLSLSKDSLKLFHFTVFSSLWKVVYFKYLAYKTNFVLKFPHSNIL